jgi:hypothetical protein
MHRWHAERNLMLRRWRQELANHGDGVRESKNFWRFPTSYLAPPSLAPDVDCHCARGIGTMRKTDPHDCGRPRCGCCQKFYVPKARHNKKLAALRFEALASDPDERFV